MKYFLFFCWLFLILAGCDQENSSPETVHSIPPSIHSISDLREHLNSSSALGSQAIQFIENSSSEQKQEVLLFVLDPSSTLSRKALDLLSIVALKNVVFQEELLRFLDTEAAKKIEASERLIPRIGGSLLLRAVQLDPPLSETGHYYLVRCLEKSSQTESLLNAIQTLLSSHNSSEQQFGLKSLERLSIGSQESILVSHLATAGIQKEVALKLAFLGNSSGADLLLDSLIAPVSPEWERDVGKAFFKLNKKGVSAFRKALKSNSPEKIKHVFRLQHILKYAELLPDLLPFLEIPEFRDQAHDCLCVATNQDMKFDPESWKKILHDKK